MARLPMIDGLRGLAIVAVIYQHTVSLRVDASGFPVLSVLSNSGWLGVNLFFFLSGFVLYLPYVSGERRLSCAHDIWQFYKRRAMRLLPLFGLCVLMLSVFYAPLDLSSPAAYLDLLRYMTFTTWFSERMFFPGVNWVLWSLVVEIWFSILFPFLLLFIRRFGWGPVLAVGLSLSTATRIFGEWLVVGPRLPLNFISDSVIGRLDDFLFGMLAAHWSLRTDDPRGAVWKFVGGAVLIYCGMALWTAWLSGRFPSWTAGTFNTLLCVGMLLCTVTLLRSKSSLTRVFTSWPLQMMGLMSYSLYLWHGVIAVKLAPFVTGFWPYIGYLVLTFSISWYTYRYIEFRGVPDWRQLLPVGRFSPFGMCLSTPDQSRPNHAERFR